MGRSLHQMLCLLAVVAAALVVYAIAHWSALTNPYVINDDVRQQIYWMQQWNDPELFRDDLLARYARNYDPWGVIAIYYLASPLMNPVQFTKVVAGVLYVVTAAFLFGLCLQFRNEIAALVIVCCFFFFTTFLAKVSGAISQSFAFPLLIAYLFFLSRENTLGGALVIFLASLLNPYIFLVCLTTQAIYLAWHYRPSLVQQLWKTRADTVSSSLPVDHGRNESLTGSQGSREALAGTIRWLILVNLPVIVGVICMFLKYVVFKNPEFGELVTWSSMAGQIEYTAAGRYEIIPVPSLIRELVGPWGYYYPSEGWGVIFAWMGAVAIIAVFAVALLKWKKNVDLKGFRVFAYLIPASLILYGVAYVLLMRLFVPGRYIEFPFTVFYAVALGVAVTVILESFGLSRKKLLVVLGIAVLMAGARNWHVGIYDCSSDAPLYKFLETTPKSSLIAGPPDLMDNVQTFARRKALVTYELSHTWLDKYWDIIKARTLDLFRAYYAANPEEIRNFAQHYGISYLVVREKDFSPENLKKGDIHFEPFDDYIRKLVNSRTRFAALDENQFPVVYRGQGIRVLKIGRDP